MSLLVDSVFVTSLNAPVICQTFSDAYPPLIFRFSLYQSDLHREKLSRNVFLIVFPFPGILEFCSPALFSISFILSQWARELSVLPQIGRIFILFGTCLQNMLFTWTKSIVIFYQKKRQKNKNFKNYNFALDSSAKKLSCKLEKSMCPEGTFSCCVYLWLPEVRTWWMKLKRCFEDRILKVLVVSDSCLGQGSRSRMSRE